VAIVDGDTLLEPDALKRTAEAFAADPDNLVAVGGTLRIANGALIQSNTVVEARMPAPGWRRVRRRSTCVVFSAAASPGRGRFLPASHRFAHSESAGTSG
jgi:cellulose synthase/poly-beta-1,6-N-acetylglucosamine synthase-like glycosyltransferase